MKRIFILLLPFFTLLVSCNDDFEINSEWEDITIVYGLLNPSDTAHYIRINKAFLGDGDVSEMASESDSLQYDSLSVRLLEYQITDETRPYSENSWNRTDRSDIILYKTDEIEKDDQDYFGNSGTFGNDVNFLYKTTEILNEGYKYRVEIRVPGKDEVVWSDVYMIYGILVKGQLTHPTLKLNLANEKNPLSIEYVSAVYGKIFQTYLIVNYLDIIGEDTTWQSVKINYDEQVVDDVRLPYEYTGTDITQSIGGIYFYESMARLIPEKNNVRRIIRGIDFVFLAGGSELNNYLNISQTVVNYGQETPEYSNIINGIGLFDARFNYSVTNKIMSNPSIDSLINGRFTNHLRFDWE